MKKIISLVCVLAMLVVCAAVPCYAAAEADTPVVIGYQYSNVYQNSKGEDVRNIRFVAVGNDVSYSKVGFSVSAADHEKSWNGASSLVYQTLNAVGNDGSVAKISAQTYGAQYLFAYVVKGVPANVDISFAVQAFAVDAGGNTVSGEPKQVTVSGAAEVPSGPVYPIPADAVDYTIGGEVFTVVRPLQELKNALSVSTANSRVILGCNIDGNGQTLASAGLKVGVGSVIEGNNCTISNFKGTSIFDLANGAEIVIRNLQFGTEAAPLEVTGAVVAGYTRCVSRWENVAIYANLTANGGDIGVWYGKANGSHTFVNCSVTATVVDSGSGNAAAWVGTSAEEANSWTFEGCEIRGSVTGKNNAGGLIGYMFGSISAKDCTNYAAVSGTSNAGGFVAHMTVTANSGDSVTMTNCVNYGKISGGSIGGLMGQIRKNTVITNCANYGDLTGTGNTGGIVGGTSASAKLTIESSANYGKAQSTGNAAGFVANNQINECVIKNSINTGAVTSNTHAGGFISWNACILTVEHCLNAGCISGAHTAGITGRPDAGKAVRITDCANIGVIKQTASDGSATNIGGYMTGANGEITNCYGFGKLEHTKYPGILVCQYSYINTSSGNKYYEFGNTTSATTIGLDETSKVATLEAALELLEARFTDLSFEIANGAIRLKTAA